MAKIIVQGIKLYGYHGCMDEEHKTGRAFIVDVVLEADLTQAAAADTLSETINYVTIYEIVKEEMAIRSKLIEHVAKRIYDHLRRKFPQATKAEVQVTKLHPPINGIVERVSAVISE